MTKLFRWHRGGLKESLATAIEVNDFSDVEEIVCTSDGFPVGFFSNVRTEYCGDDSARCGELWSKTYYVLADSKQGRNAVVGMSNFPK